MVKWIYILRCEDDVLFVGYTKRLYTDLYNHKFIEVLGLYKLHDLINYLQHEHGDDNPDILSKLENTSYIKEEFIKHMKNENEGKWKEITGSDKEGKS